MANQTNDEGLTPVNLFCTRNHISRNSFYKEKNCRRLRIVKVGSRTYVTPQDAQEWIERLRQEALSLEKSKPENAPQDPSRPKVTPAVTVDPNLQPEL